MTPDKLNQLALEIAELLDERDLSISEAVAALVWTTTSVLSAAGVPRDAATELLHAGMDVQGALLAPLADGYPN